jgi:hypothetical protein
MRESDQRFLERFQAQIEPVLHGDSVLEAAAGFEARFAEARLALAFREVVRT